MRTVCNVCSARRRRRGRLRRQQQPDSREGTLKRRARPQEGGSGDREGERGEREEREGGELKRGRKEGRKFAVQTSASESALNQTAEAEEVAALVQQSDVRCLLVWVHSGPAPLLSDAFILS